MTDARRDTEVDIACGEYRASISRLGGAVRSLSAGRVELLDPFPRGGSPDGARGAVLAPWPNRLLGGRYEWDGVEHHVPINEPDRGTALHGLVLEHAWDVRDASTEQVTLGYAIAAPPGYPFVVDLTVTYRLEDAAGLTVTTRAENRGKAPAPFGLGHHPYLTAPDTDLINDCSLSVPAATYLPPDDRGIPGAPRSVANSPLDLATLRRMGDIVVDASFTQLHRTADGTAVVRFAGPSGRGCELELDQGYRYVHVYTGDTLPPEERRRSIAIEPMTCPANALQSGVDVIRLEPGRAFSARWTLRAMSP